ncbi:MAG: cupin domain-containing protein [Alphaproteobacteria bacterium]|nr:cupin domain-containing protein [Alphaproteobacteria bacterium]
MSADDVTAALGLVPHPEGGYFRETYRHKPGDGGRGAKTAIYYLLRAGEVSRWHRVRDADEIWHFYAGAALRLEISPEGRTVAAHLLGPDIAAGHRPQILVPRGHWQSARCLGDWTLVGCTVAPAFDFAGFEMAPEGWAPTLRKP